MSNTGRGRAITLMLRWREILGKRTPILETPLTGEERDASIKVTILPLNYPREVFSGCQYENVIKSLSQLTEFLPSGRYPNIYKHHLERGGIIIYCANEESADWVRRKVFVVELNDGTKIKAGSIEDINTTTILLKIPPEMINESAHEITLRVGRCNPHLNTDRWECVCRNAGERGDMIFYRIDRQSAEVLQENGYIIFLGMTRATVHVLG